MLLQKVLTISDGHSAEVDTGRSILFLISFLHVNPFPKQILGSSKLEEFADNNFKFDEKGIKFSKWVENSVGKGEIAR